MSDTSPDSYRYSLRRSAAPPGERSYLGLFCWREACALARRYAAAEWWSGDDRRRRGPRTAQPGSADGSGGPVAAWRATARADWHYVRSSRQKEAKMVAKDVDLSFVHYLPGPDEDDPKGEGDFCICALTLRGEEFLVDHTDTTSLAIEGQEFIPAGNAWVETRSEFERLAKEAQTRGLVIECTEEPPDAA